MHAAYGDTSGIRRIVKWSNQHLRSSFQLFRSRNVFHDGIQQRSDGAGRSFPVFTHPVVLGRTVDYREVQLVFCGVEAEHQVEHHFIYFFRTAVRFVYLVYHYDRFQSNLQGFLKHEAGLRHRTFKSVHQQNTSVGHVQDTFHFSTEVGVSRSIDNVDFCTVVIDGYVFRKNGYTSFTLQVVVIQNQFTVGLVVAEQVSRQHHLVHQSCFSVVNVSNNGNVSNVLHTIPIYNCVQNYCFSAKGGYFMQGFYIFWRKLDCRCRSSWGRNFRQGFQRNSSSGYEKKM